MADDDRSILMVDRDTGAHANLAEQVRTLQQQVAGLEAQAALLDLALDAIITLDMSGRILAWSHGAARMYGWSEGEAIGHVLDELLKAEHQEPTTTAANRLQRHGRWDGEIDCHTRSGERRHVAVRQVLGRDRSGTPTRLVSIHSDVTEQRASAAIVERRREEEARLDHERLSLVSHELRAPLTAIKQFTTIILKGLAGELNQEQRQYQQIVLNNVGHLQSIVDSLLERARLEGGTLIAAPEPILVETVVADAIDTLQIRAREGGIALSSDLPPDLPAVAADRMRLQQILIILIENAITFTPPGGDVTVAARMADDPRYLLLEVSDSGCGFSPEIGERLFEPFYQAPDTRRNGGRGLGLGLYICRRLVTHLGGWIQATSQPRQGSTFSFTLPVASAVDGRRPVNRVATPAGPARLPGARSDIRPQPR